MTNIDDPPLPDLFVIGAGKSGTTSLHHYLGQHPAVCMADPKEPFFFDLHYEEGPGWYEGFFDHRDGELFLGESTPSYLHNGYVADRLREMIPDAKILVTLRNPVDRAYSHWWMRGMQVGPKEETRTFERAVEDNIAAIREQPELDPRDRERQRHAEWTGERRVERDYVEIGHYAEHLRRWFDRFPEERIHVVLASELRTDPDAVVQRLWQSMGLNQIDGPLETPMMNVRKTRSMKAVRSLAETVGIYRFWGQFPQRIRDRVKAVLARFSEGRPPMERRVRSRLVEYYEPWNRRLEKMIDHDLSHWDR